MKIKGNWALGMVLLYGGFAAFVLGFLFYSSFQKVELVTPNYYEQEIRYQDQIEKIRRTKALSESLTWSLSGRMLTIRFPEALKDKVISGTVTFYRPSDSSMDRKVPLAVGASLLQDFPLVSLAAGWWRMKVEWTAGTESYYHEEEFNL